LSLNHPEDDAIGPENVRVGIWQQRLVLFQRIAGGFMMFKGLVQWGALLGVGGARFLELPLDAQVATVFFAIVDILAGVGLWLGSTWGGALWLIAAALQIVAGIGFVQLSGSLVLLTLLEILMLAVYVLARFMAHHEEVR
jgi:fatty acid desaturase